MEAPVSTWTCEDDELLKNAIEAGTSFESLSTGDIECVDSAISSVWMNDGLPDDFNPMLKRVKSNVVEKGDSPQYTDYMHGEAKHNHLGSPVSNCKSEHQHLSNLETVSAAAEIPINPSVTQEENQPSEMLRFLGCDVHSDAMDQIPCHNMENLGQSTYGNLAGSSGSSMYFRKLDEFFLTDVDGNYADIIPVLDPSLLNFNWEENMAEFERSIIPGGGACSGELVKDGQFMNCSSESPMLASIPATNRELTTCISDIHVLPSASAASNPEVHIACAPEARLSVPAANSVVHVSCVPEAQILPSKPNVCPNLPEVCNGVISCILNTEDTEIPCNDDALITLPSPRGSASKRKNHQPLGVRAMYLIEALKGKPHSCETVQSKKADIVESNKEKPESS